MITIKDFDTRFPKLNESYFSLLSNEDKELYIKRVSIYHKALLKLINSEIKLKDIEISLKNSKNYFVPVSNDKKDIYQLMADDMDYIYLRNNIYIERLDNSQLQILDSENYDDIMFLVQETFINVIADFPEKSRLTNYGPETSNFFANSSNLIIGVRIDNDFFPDNINAADLIVNRDLELDFLKKFVQVKIKQKIGIDATVIIYTKDSVKVVDNGVSCMISK